MTTIIKMLLIALGAAAGAAVVLSGLFWFVALAISLLHDGAAVAVAVTPIAVCLTGVAYAASRTGYGG